MTISTNTNYQLPIQNTNILMKAREFLNKIAEPCGYKILRVQETVDFYLHKYDSYEHYKSVQIHHNKRKIDNVWADAKTLTLMCDELKVLLKRDSINGLCHGTRNGYEQNYIASIDGYNAIGTDISPTAKDYQNSVQWDFHEINKEWIGKFDFVYSNSLDQSWDPKLALSVWLKQVKQGGFVVIEHTHAHSPTGAGEMDPFGVRPTVFPYVIADWFDLDVSIKFIKSTKQNDL